MKGMQHSNPIVRKEAKGEGKKRTLLGDKGHGGASILWESAKKIGKNL